jgi:hypothetical protein
MRAICDHSAVMRRNEIVTVIRSIIGIMLTSLSSERRRALVPTSISKPAMRMPPQEIGPRGLSDVPDGRLCERAVSLAPKGRITCATWAVRSSRMRAMRVFWRRRRDSNPWNPCEFGGFQRRCLEARASWQACRKSRKDRSLRRRKKPPPRSFCQDSAKTRELRRDLGAQERLGPGSSAASSGRSSMATRAISRAM